MGHMEGPGIDRGGVGKDANIGLSMGAGAGAANGKALLCIRNWGKAA
jgi:hypothetical protein